LTVRLLAQLLRAHVDCVVAPAATAEGRDESQDHVSTIAREKLICHSSIVGSSGIAQPG
jgi:hypothetical protein